MIFGYNTVTGQPGLPETLSSTSKQTALVRLRQGETHKFCDILGYIVRSYLYKKKEDEEVAKASYGSAE